ncbi:hypothetical protein EHI8A_072900 [Entamoeba histolytica HM-1:IMSS-B]|uniref:Transmembrane protein n=5 Tax=Entamoeba histolytica TaxID=5759 RepID=C4M5R5_ENTH1|nr:hypothetical protein EHI_129910 [Entamoeba histolytica HM-1:IMSS]EMD45910.1 Hypothetical protein EHI5A_066920 [Entamoeba histolytica KU27]EMH75324.1 hypothetical protein EHI8A_072900 [Entamoeba histolytica HM-1:IMSS-B]ENY63671.1 hypothetical protein EHI7A_081750 [Entamoeba histolytica HM-1:IMSS-A]GAT96778.1 hypothetical protein CL6EHI_129910 [Entamoeba histolytica]EAL46430.1 hypothetical protein EHI_129910 [Entamoeba histolytica HM-1:IMSS]|eukprot:XP_651817.1 hypothetical protein EHI_129910 [Entamoeba histolytica HM-1:IMSS]
MQTPQQVLVSPTYVALPQYQQPVYIESKPSPQQTVHSVISIPVPVVPQTNKENEINDTAANISLLFIIIGFFFPLVWIINYVLFSNSKDKRASLFARLSLSMFALGIIFCALLICFMVIF